MVKPFAASLLLIASFAVSAICLGQDSIPKEKGSLAALVERVSENLTPRDSDKFRVPTAGQLKAWKFVVESLYANRPDDAAKMIKQLSFPYVLKRFTESSNGRDYFVLEESAPYQAGWGFYVFDLATPSNLVLQAPHPRFDSNTEHQTIDAFLQSRAAVFMLAGAHRRANKQTTPCTEPKSSDPDATYPVSDVAHAVATPFHAIHEAVVKAKPGSVAVQLHGMAERDVCPNAFISSGSATVTTNSKKLLSCLTKAGVEAQIYDGKTSCPLTALSNVQGRYSNGETADPCTKGVSLSPEPGAFIHIEQESSIRKSREAWQGVIAGLKCAFPATDAAPSVARKSFVFESQGNPPVTVFYAAPAQVNDKTKVIMVMAGRQRNADEYLDSWVAWAAKNNYLVLAPRFDEENWPEPLGYNFGNIATGREANNTPNPKPKWAFTVIEQMFENAKQRFAIKAKQYDLFGHSAGGQFVHRFMLYTPDNKVRIVIAANPGFYTLPDMQTMFPYGVKNSPFAIHESDLKAWTKRELILMRGTADVERTESLRQTPQADAQGKTRFERAGFMYQQVKKFEPKSKWVLIDVPGVAHDQKGMAEAAQRFLETRN
jgi:hypothetical protein